MLLRSNKFDLSPMTFHSWVLDELFSGGDVTSGLSHNMKKWDVLVGIC
jgi:hypothetical protein